MASNGGLDEHGGSNGSVGGSGGTVGMDVAGEGSTGGGSSGERKVGRFGREGATPGAAHALFCARVAPLLVFIYQITKYLFTSRLTMVSQLIDVCVRRTGWFMRCGGVDVCWSWCC